MSKKWKIRDSLPLNTRGRMRRRDFIMLNVLFMCIGFIILPIYLLALYFTGFYDMLCSDVIEISTEQIIIYSAVHIAIVIAILPMLVIGFWATIRRLHDMNFSGWWVLFIMFVSSLLNGFGGTLCTIFLCSIKGTTGENKYGADPFEDTETINEI